MAKRRSRVQYELAAFTALEDYLETFLMRYRTPTRPLSALTTSLEEIGRERLLLLSREQGTSPPIRPMRSESR